MKVLLVSEDVPRAQLGGLARHVVVLGNALIEAGHEVVLMGCSQPRYEDCAEEVAFRGRFIAGFSSVEEGWKERRLGFFNPWKRPYMARRIAMAIRRHAAGFDVVHYHGHHPMVNRFLPADFPFVQTRHDQGSECLTHLRFKDGDVCRALDPSECATCIHPRPNALRTALSVYAVKRYRKQTAEAFERHPVVFVSDFLRRRFQSVVPMASGTRSIVVHAFIDENAPDAVSSAVRAGNTTVHVAGRLVPTKGILAFVRLIKPKLPPGWEVHVYGDGPERDELQALCGPQIIWHGHRSTAEVMASSRRATAAVVPSVWEEPWGAVTAEAIRFGVPCYALRRGGTPELERYGAPGLLRLHDDLGALVDALLAGPIPPHEQGGVPADVRARLPEIIAVYQLVRQGASLP